MIGGSSPRPAGRGRASVIDRGVGRVPNRIARPQDRNSKMNGNAVNNVPVPGGSRNAPGSGAAARERRRALPIDGSAAHRTKRDERAGAPARPAEPIRGRHRAWRPPGRRRTSARGRAPPLEVHTATEDGSRADLRYRLLYFHPSVLHRELTFETIRGGPRGALPVSTSGSLRGRGAEVRDQPDHAAGAVRGGDRPDAHGLRDRPADRGGAGAPAGHAPARDRGGSADRIRGRGQLRRAFRKQVGAAPSESRERTTGCSGRGDDSSCRSHRDAVSRPFRARRGDRTPRPTHRRNCPWTPRSPVSPLCRWPWGPARHRRRAGRWRLTGEVPVTHGHGGRLRGRRHGITAGYAGAMFVTQDSRKTWSPGTNFLGLPLRPGGAAGRRRLDGREHRPRARLQGRRRPLDRGRLLRPERAAACAPPVVPRREARADRLAGGAGHHRRRRRELDQGSRPGQGRDDRGRLALRGGSRQPPPAPSTRRRPLGQQPIVRQLGAGAEPAEASHLRVPDGARPAMRFTATSDGVLAVIADEAARRVTSTDRDGGTTWAEEVVPGSRHRFSPSPPTRSSSPASTSTPSGCSGQTVATAVAERLTAPIEASIRSGLPDHLAAGQGG